MSDTNNLPTLDSDHVNQDPRLDSVEERHINRTDEPNDDTVTGQPVDETGPDSSNGKTADVEEKVSQEATKEAPKEDTFEDVVEPGDVDKVAPEVPTKEQLDEIINKIKKMNPTDKKKLLAGLASQNSINANNHDFTTMSKSQMLKERMKKRLQGLQTSRLTKESKTALLSKKSNNFKKKKNKVVPPNLSAINSDLKDLQNVLDESTDDSDVEPSAVEDAPVVDTTVDATADL